MAKKPTHQLVVNGYVYMSGSKEECENSQGMMRYSGDPRMANAKLEVKKI